MQITAGIRDTVDTLQSLAYELEKKSAGHHRMIFARNASKLFTREDTRAKAEHFIRWMANVDTMARELAVGQPNDNGRWDNRRGL